jgi:hypothetical protein
MSETQATEPIESAPEDVKRVILEVLRLEKERLYEGRPRLKEDIKKIIEESVQ